MYWRRSPRQYIHTTYDCQNGAYLIQTDSGQHWVKEHDIQFDRRKVLRVESVSGRPKLGLVQWTNPDLRSTILPFDGKKQHRLRAVRHMLNYDGVVVIKGGISKRLCRKVKQFSEEQFAMKNKINVTPIFNTDKKAAARLQADLSYDDRDGRQDKGKAWTRLVNKGNKPWPQTSKYGKYVERMSVQVGNLVARHISARHHPKQPVILQSPANQIRQYVHRDYQEETCLIRRLKPNPLYPERSAFAYKPVKLLARKASYGIIVALEDRTRFVCWPGSHTWRRRPHVYKNQQGTECWTLGGVHADDVVCPEIDTGDVIIFMDTLAHAGSDYEHPNTRIHFYCDDVVEDEQCRRHTSTNCPAGCMVAQLRQRKKCVLRDPNYTDTRVTETVDGTELSRHTPRWWGKGDTPPHVVKKVYDAWLRQWRFEEYKKKNEGMVPDITYDV